jgi:hypothetical protein
MKGETPIVRLFFAKMKPDFMKLSESDRIDFMAKDRANLDDLGMKAISMIECSVTDSEWDYVGVEGWPSMEAIKKREQFENEELKISKYVEYKTLLGVEQSFENYGK